jgi:hypothetical protein
MHILCVIKVLDSANYDIGVKAIVHRCTFMKDQVICTYLYALQVLDSANDDIDRIRFKDQAVVGGPGSPPAESSRASSRRSGKRKADSASSLGSSVSGRSSRRQSLGASSVGGFSSRSGSSVSMDEIRKIQMEFER